MPASFSARQDVHEHVVVGLAVVPPAAEVASPRAPSPSRAACLRTRRIAGGTRPGTARPTHNPSTPDPTQPARRRPTGSSAPRCADRFPAGKCDPYATPPPVAAGCRRAQYQPCSDHAVRLSDQGRLTVNDGQRQSIVMIPLMPLMTRRFARSSWVARGGVEPPTFRFSGSCVQPGRTGRVRLQSRCGEST
jgi:hypothetical protein